MLYGFECECGDEVDARRIAIGYQTCLRCGDVEAKQRKFLIANFNKQGYQLFSKPDDLRFTNPKRTT